MGKAIKGLSINVEATGRAEVVEPISKWPEVEGLKLADSRDLSIDVLNNARAVRVKVGETLMPAVNLDDENAVLINENGSQSVPQFSPNGANKGKDVSFYGTAWAQRKARGMKSDTMGA